MAIQVTPRAVEQMKTLIAARGKPTVGIRVGVQGGGCSGFSYLLEFADEVRPHDKVFDFDGVKVLVDPKSYLYLNGSQLDYVTSLMESGFKWSNPNAKGTCGCGQSVAF